MEYGPIKKIAQGRFFLFNVFVMQMEALMLGRQPVLARGLRPAR